MHEKFEDLISSLCISQKENAMFREWLNMLLFSFAFLSEDGERKKKVFIYCIIKTAPKMLSDPETRKSKELGTWWKKICIYVGS